MKRRRRVVIGAFAGLASGLVASAAMNLFQRKISVAARAEQRNHGAQSQQTGAPAHGAAAYLENLGVDSSSDDAAERTANLISARVFDHPLSGREKEIGGTIFHYAFGATSGGLYGLVGELVPLARTGWGLPFGAAVWLIADEVVVPALGLSKDAREYSASIHAYALGAHLVYGLTTELALKVFQPTSHDS
jgi:uncharacterized membrane protein YagU involved in acid resistance